jgi:uncharacterized protein (DUF433 family)
MTTLVPMHYVEMTESNGQLVPRIAGTRIRVSEVVQMYVKHNTPIDWIVENFEVLSYAKIYAALAYYYDHPDEIDAELDKPEEVPEGAITTEQWMARIRERNEK